MSSDWYYAKDGQQRGPFPETHVRQLAASGQLLPHDLVWHEGLADWVAAQSLPGLIPGARPDPAEGAADATVARAKTSHSTVTGGSLPDREAEFPPWLAALLAVGTFGLFSLWYTWR